MTRAAYLTMIAMVALLLSSAAAPASSQGPCSWTAATETVDDRDRSSFDLYAGCVGVRRVKMRATAAGKRSRWFVLRPASETVTSWHVTGLADRELRRLVDAGTFSLQVTSQPERGRRWIRQRFSCTTRTVQCQPAPR